MKTLSRMTSFHVWGLAFALGIAVYAPSAHANVYASNIKINGGLTTATAAQGSSVNISYILNEAATAGVTINILSNGVVVRTLNLPGGGAGALRGLNSVVWDGKNTGGNYVGVGPGYSVSITASATGYSTWTMITDDNNEGNYVYSPRGIAVNQNTNSPYYGRVFVCNAAAGGSGKPGDGVGMLKLNADGSYADEGGFSDGGHAWAGDFFSPWKVEVSADDYVYINDWTSSGEVYRWDQTLSAASQLYVLRQDNWAPGCNMSGPFVTGTGPDTKIWMADIAYPSSQGVLMYAVTNYPELAPDQWVCYTNDTGLPVIPISYPLSLYPYDIALDKAGNYYTIQYRANTTDASPRVMRFPANYDINTNAVADWDSATLYGDAQMSNDWGYATGVAVDPTGTYLAVAFAHPTTTYGNTKIFDAATGALVTNLDYQVTINGSALHRDRDCSWDAVGNVYLVDSAAERWRAWSPPGANSSTTVPPVALEITAAVVPIQITSFALAGGVFTINFTAGASDAASDFEVLSAGTVSGTYTLAGGQNITGGSGVFQATVPAGASQQYYKIHRK
jgi:hypothetical protein